MVSRSLVFTDFDRLPADLYLADHHAHDALLPQGVLRGRGHGQPHRHARHDHTLPKRIKVN